MRIALLFGAILVLVPERVRDNDVIVAVGAYGHQRNAFLSAGRLTANQRASALNPALVRQFRRCVRDNGQGVDSEGPGCRRALRESRISGHAGTRYAGGRQAGGFSRLGFGTEVELTNPAAFACVKSNVSQRSQSSGG